MRTLEQLKEFVEKNISKDDLIKAILYSYHKSKGVQIPKSHAFIQKAFFKMKLEHPDMFISFIFDQSGIIPFSDELDSILFRLETSGILSAENPAYETYTQLKYPDVLEKSYSKFKIEKQKDIDLIASSFSNLVSQGLV